MPRALAALDPLHGHPRVDGDHAVAVGEERIDVEFPDFRMVRGELRRTGRRGVSLRATGCWELQSLHATWRSDGMEAVRELITPTQVEPQTDGVPGARRVLVHSTGYRLSPYADVKPAGDDTKSVARKLWHRSPGSPG